MSTPQMARKNLQQQQAPSAALLHQSSIGKLLHHSQTRTSDAILISFEKLISFFLLFSISTVPDPNRMGGSSSTEQMYGGSGMLRSADLLHK